MEEAGLATQQDRMSGREKLFLLFRGIEPRSFGRPNGSVVTISTELFRLYIYIFPPILHVSDALLLCKYITLKRHWSLTPVAATTGLYVRYHVTASIANSVTVMTQI